MPKKKAKSNPPQSPYGRKPKGPDGKEREWTPWERSQLFRRGFMDGAGCHAMRPDHKDLQDYADGYTQGYQARSRAMARHAKKVGYVPNILRLSKR